MSGNGIGIIGTGYYVPNRVMTNKDLEKIVNTSDEWIYSKTGIRARRIADPQEATSDLAIFAANEALRDAGVHPNDIDLIIVATSSPDMIIPATAPIVQGKIGAFNSAAFDVGAVCAGFIYGLTVAYSMMQTLPQYKKVLVIGAETYSRILDWTDRNTCVFFGDGAGAVVLGQVEKPLGIQSSYMRTDGRGATVIKFLGGGSRHPTTAETLANKFHRFEMNGKQVWDFATTVMPEAVREVLKQKGLQPSDLDLVIGHQANINIIQTSLDKLGLTMDKTFTNIEKYGNTAGASIPLALAEAQRAGRLKKGDKVVLVGFGGGLAYGAIYLVWGRD